jgi:hypothetical protein
MISCEKDENDNFTENGYRISEIDNGYRKVKFTYNDNNLIQTQTFLNEAGNWIEAYKTEYNYINDSVKANWFTWESNKWSNTDKRDFFIVDNQLLVEIDYELDAGNWIVDWIWRYEYSDDGLIEWFKLKPDNEGLTQRKKGELIYNNHILTEYKEYASSDEYLSELLSFEYESDNLKRIIFHEENSNWEQNMKIEYDYKGDKKTAQKWYSWYSSTGWVLDDSISYSYDNNGNLVNVGGNGTTYKYENGTGNALLFVKEPEDLMYQEPTYQ